VPTVTVYRFKVYDITTDEIRLSRRWGTREGIKAARGAPLEETATEVDSALVGQEVEGLTARDFDPRRRTGFQTQVTV
jgi:hypothetical protein